MLKIAQQNYPKIDFELKDMRELDYPQESFDAVSIPYSLFHIQKHEVPRVIQKSYRDA